jgi:UDP-glucuronate 4-epimerase
MNVLVTGGAGFIGSATVKALVKRGDRAIVTDNFNDYYDPQLKRDRINVFLGDETAGFVVYEGDIRDEVFLESVFAKESIDNVVHLAAMPGVRASLENPMLCADVNVGGTIAVFEACVRHGVRTVVYASSSSVYGNNTKMPYAESDSADMPVSPYAASKKADELFAHVYNHVYGLKTTGLRFFTVYGPWGRPDMGVFTFVKDIFEGNTVKVFNFGELRRNFTYIDDIVSGILTTLDAGLEYDIMNIGGDRDDLVLDYIAAVEKYSGKKADIALLPLPKTDPASTVADISKLRTLGWSPTTHIDQGVRKFVEWYREYYRP